MFGLSVSCSVQTFSDDLWHYKLVQVRGLDLKTSDEFVFEGVLGRGVEHLLLDVGFVRAKDDEGEFVAMTALWRHVTHVEARVATVLAHLDSLEIIPERCVVALGCGSVFTSWIVEHFVDDDFFHIIAEFVNAVFVFALLFHGFVGIDAFIGDFHSGSRHVWSKMLRRVHKKKIKRFVQFCFSMIFITWIKQISVVR